MSTPGIRYAAWRLAALHPRDREWLLRRLPSSVREAWLRVAATQGWQARARHAAALPPPSLVPPSPPAACESVSAVRPAWPALAEAMKDGPLPTGLAAAVASWTPASEEAA